MQDFCGGPFWNNETFWADENPSLTPCFKQTVLIWVPCLFLFLYSILDIKWRLKSRYSYLPWSFLNISKFLILILLIALLFTDLSLFISFSNEVDGLIYPVHYVAVGIKITTFVYVGFLMALHKYKGHLTSGLLFQFWIMLTFLAIPQLRSEVVTMGQGVVISEEYNQFRFISYMIYFSLISIMVILNCFADKPPIYTTYPKSQHPRPCPELTVSFLDKIHFFWFTKMCYLGWRRPLVEDDLYDIPPQDTCAEVHPPFEREFNASLEKNKNKKADKDALATTTTHGSTLRSLMRAFGGSILFSAMLRLIADTLLISAPLVLGLIIRFIDMNEAMWKGYLLAFVLFLIQALQTYLMGQQYHYNFNVGYNIRGALMSAIYRKSLRLSSAAKRNTTVGEIVNLMAVDSNRFFEVLPEFHAIWAGGYVIGMVTFVVYTILGPAVFAGLLVALITFPFSIFIGTRLKALQVEQMKFKDERVKSVNEILNGMKVLKLYAWEPSFEKLIRDIREIELSIMRRIAVYNAASFFLFTLAPFLIALASFLTYTLWMGQTLTTATVFVPLALFNILRVPMTFYPLVINFTMQTLVAMGRIDKFLNSSELDPTSVSSKPSNDAMTIANGNFSWGGKVAVLKNINIFVKKGILTAVVGPVGSGKSSLISAFLGEMEKLTGEANVDGRIAYVPQQAWIQNATLRENILFGKPYIKKLYDQVLHACALVPDLAILPGGDQIEIGEKGINLSGGQKQRVSLARAVYSGADIFIFDDPLSAVDSHVGKHIFHNVMSEHGILKSKSRFLVTHALSYLPKVDEIYVMMNGEITESGTYSELLNRGGGFAEFLLHYLQEQGEEVLELIDEEEVKVQKEVLSTLETRRFSNGSLVNKLVKRGSVSEHAQRRNSEAREVKNEMSKLIENEEAMTGTVTWALYGRYFKRMGILLSIVAIGSNLLYHTASVYSNVWLARWSQLGSDNTTDVNNNINAGVYGALGVIQAIFLIIGAIAFAIGCILVAKNLHNNMLETIMRLPMWFFDTTPIGRILNRFARDMDVIDNVLPIYIRNWILLLFTVAAIYIVISFSTPWFMVVALPIIALYYFIQKFYIETARQTRRMESLTRSPIFAHFAESVSGQSTIRAYAEQQRFIGDSEKKIDYNHAIGYHVMVANRWAHLNLQLLGAFVVLFAALFSVIGRDRNDVDSATAGLSLSYALQVATFMFFLIRIAAEVETNLVAVERVEEYSDKPQEAPWKTVDVNPSWPQKGVVVFQDFKVRYREGLDLVLKGISFETKSQEKVGIVGRTGAGKSSLTLSLFRIIEAAGGKIIIDGIEIAEIGLHSLRSRLTIIPQDPVLFSGNLRMNIDPFKAYSDDAIWTALEHSHLKSFVKALPDGLDHKIAEGGENLSVGQRQLVCLARALLRKTKVLILDEATAAIDFETDELIQKTIRSQFNDCTILTIAHRLNTIMDSDRIIVLDQGMIVEYDTPQVLLSNKNSIFYGMAKNAGLVDETI